MDHIEDLVAQLESFYEMSRQSRYSMEWVSNQINAVGQKHNLVNSFPFCYYEKIKLDKTGQLRKNKNDLMATEQPATLLEELKEMMTKREKSESKEKKKKKEKKDKKKKSHKNEKRSYSSDSNSIALKEEKNKE